MKETNCPFIDRRTKLIPCQREMILWYHEKSLMTVTELSKKFSVSRRTIDLVLNPGLKQKRKKAVYNSEKNTKHIRSHRLHIKNLQNL